VTATGDPAPTFSLTGAPAWLSIGTTTGVLAGKPPNLGAGPYTFTFTITAGNGVSPDATQSFTLTVDQAPTITSAGSATFTVGTTGTSPVTATGNPAPTFGLTGAPSWVSIGTTTGVLTGMPPNLGAGPYRFTFGVTAGNGVLPNATHPFTLTVDQAPAITSAAGTTFTEDTAGNFTVVATGFPAPTLGESDPLPTGVSFDPKTGVLGGTPAEGTAGTYTLHFTAHNGIGADFSQTFTLTINPAPVLPPPPPPPAARPIFARLVTVKAGKHKKRLVIDLFYADTGEKKGEVPSPYQSPAFKNVQVSVRSSTGLGVADEVVVTARKGKKNVTTTFGA
jgi:hypothetical protein